MLVFGRGDFLFASDAEQQLRIDPAALCANDCRGAIDFAQLPFERLALRWLNEIDLVQEQNVRPLDLQACSVTQFGKTNEHVGVDYRNDTVEPALRQRLLDVEHERFGLGEPGRLDDDLLRRNFLDDLADRRLKFAEQRTADTAAAKLSDADVFAFDDFRVDG